eukprot:scaffold116102_cov36-Prasinocladus_malaysianus.AAC.2
MFTTRPLSNDFLSPLYELWSLFQWTGEPGRAQQPGRGAAGWHKRPAGGQMGLQPLQPPQALPPQRVLLRDEIQAVRRVHPPADGCGEAQAEDCKGLAST